MRSSRHPRPLGALATAAVLALAVGTAPPAAAVRTTDKVPVAVGSGGAVATVDPEATAAGLEVLRRGGNAVDAAVAAAATLGVTEPFSAGIGGGGFFVLYDAGTGQVHTIDGRETAPMAMGPDAFVGEDGEPIPFAEAVTSGLSVGVPGTPATWERALAEWGTLDLREALHPAIKVARRGFVVDQTFVDQTAANASRFDDFTSTAELYLPDGAPPEVGSVFRNRDLASTYRLLAKEGTGGFYTGPLAQDIVDTVKAPPLAPGAPEVRTGLMELGDLASYVAPLRAPTHVSYRGLEVYGMAPPSSGGSTVGEALNILETVDLGALDETQALHHYLEASALAFADRNRYVGDADVVDVPLAELLSDGFAAERACLLDPARALPKPTGPGSPDGDYAACGEVSAPGAEETGGVSTTHLTTADQWGNVVAYTLTIESTGGNAMVVPGRGFLLNNELTDFNFTSTQEPFADPNLPGPGKRPRSSMSPTIVLADGAPLLAVGSPGGSTIITTVLQILVNRLDRGMDLGAAVAAPRATQRNTAAVQAEPGFPRPALEALGHTFADNPEIGAAAGIELLDDGTFMAVAEPMRRGGGSAGVVEPTDQG